MDNYKKAILEILELSLNAPELNMGNYDEEQVRDLNNAMIEIYQTAFSVKENSPNEIAALHLHDVSNSALLEIKQICNDTEELSENFTYDEAINCDKALTQILEIIDETLP